MSFRQSILRLARGVRSRLHLLAGFACLALRRREWARKQFQGVLQCRGDDFSAYLALGRIALAEGNGEAALRDMLAARRADPDRFARVHGHLGLGWAAPAAQPAATDAAAEPPPGSAACENGLLEASLFSASPDGNDLPAGAWLWYLDPADQGGPHVEVGGGWTALWSDAEAAQEGTTRPEAGDLWPAGEPAEGDPYSWWWDLSPDELGELEDFGSESGAPETGDEPWTGSLLTPLASFYDELAHGNDGLGLDGTGAERDISGADPLGDFTSEDEARRFRDLPPIRPAEVDQVNWDDLVARFDESD